MPATGTEERSGALGSAQEPMPQAGTEERSGDSAQGNAQELIAEAGTGPHRRPSGRCVWGLRGEGRHGRLNDVVLVGLGQPGGAGEAGGGRCAPLGAPPSPASATLQTFTARC